MIRHTWVRVCAVGAAVMGLGGAAGAGTVPTPFGSFAVPDGVTEVTRDEKLDPRTGKPAGMVVLSRESDPKTVYIVVWSYALPDPAKPYDALDGAVKIGNPFDKSLTRDAAQAVQVGGVPGGRYEGKLPNGQRSVSYVASAQGHRLVALLKSAPSGSAKDTADAIARGLESFAWLLPATALATPAASAASAP